MTRQDLFFLLTKKKNQSWLKSHQGNLGGPLLRKKPVIEHYELSERQVQNTKYATQHPPKASKGALNATKN